MAAVDLRCDAALSNADWFASAPPIADPLLDSTTAGIVAFMATGRPTMHTEILDVPLSERSNMLSLVERLDHLASLGPNWDSYGAEPISRHAMLQALRLSATALRSGVMPPAIVPASDGGVQLEWHWDEDSVVELAVGRDGETTMFIDTPATNYEGPLGDSTRLDDLLDTVGR